MRITLDPDPEARLKELAAKQGMSPEAVALGALRQQFLQAIPEVVPQDEWERRLFDAAIVCGVSPPLEAMTSEGRYE